MGVLEALAYGIPCLLTENTNVATTVAAHEAGWSVELSPEAIANGIKDIIYARSELEQMKPAARALAESEYSWDRVAQQLLNKYGELLTETTVVDETLR